MAAIVGIIGTFAVMLYDDRLNKGAFVDSECDRKWYPNEDYHLMYILEIEAAYLRVE